MKFNNGVSRKRLYKNTKQHLGKSSLQLTDINADSFNSFPHTQSGSLKKSSCMSSDTYYNSQMHTPVTPCRLIYTDTFVCVPCPPAAEPVGRHASSFVSDKGLIRSSLSSVPSCCQRRCEGCEAGLCMTECYCGWI